MNTLLQNVDMMKMIRLSIAAVFLSILGSFIFLNQAHAIGISGPDTADFDGGIRYALENTTELKVTSSFVPIYYTYDPGSVIMSANSFKFENRSGTKAKVRFSYTNSAGTQSSTTLQGDGSFRVYKFTYDPNTGYYYSIVQATLIDNGSTYPVINYRLDVPTPGIIGYYAANAQNFAVENDARCDARDRSGCGQYHTYSLPFGTQCQAQGNLTAVAQVYDGDNGNLGVQPTPFNVRIKDETDGTTMSPGPSPANGEENGQTASYSFTVKPYHKYRMIVSNVYANNVMQIKLPYDAIYYNSDCKTLETTNRIYGSWGEYGIAATGVVKGIGSGSAFAGRGLSHATLCSYSFLILTNANGTGTNCSSTPTPTLGNFNTSRIIPDVAGTFPKTLATSSLSGAVDVTGLNGVYDGTGNINITGGTVAKGQSVIINAVGSTVTISGNPTYTTDPMNSIDEIPQLVIIADNINILSTVEHVDAWLVTKGTINTCSDVAKASINATNCDKQLVVNGPVMAGRLLLYRTFGSGNAEDSGTPAEIFNLRPDAYLWGLSRAASSGRIETTYQTELPPRF
ncbi:MAG: exported protein of unknown function [Candidatus Saccharibacteria bacterium]|nr:exported protein of unknown function [Candidatus Saccharibacteria bacterium]